MNELAASVLAVAALALPTGPALGAPAPKPSRAPAYDCYTAAHVDGEPIRIDFEERTFKLGRDSGGLTARDDYPAVAFLVGNKRHQILMLDGFDAPSAEVSKSTLIGVFSIQEGMRKPGRDSAPPATAGEAQRRFQFQKEACPPLSNCTTSQSLKRRFSSSPLPP